MIGQTISHYKILEKLGEGGMGEVYLAEDTALDRKVALKFLPPHYTSDAELNKRFRREAKAAAALNHPNIITVHEIGEHEGRAFIAMEYVEGESLRETVSSGQLSVNSVVDIVMQICDGLNAAHQAGIIHRDIKPENVIVDKSGRVRILDFGLAKLEGQHLTKNGKTLGTVAYLCFDRAQGKEATRNSDTWALGVVLYEMLTGKLPFHGEHDQVMLLAILNEEPEPVSVYRPEAPMELQKIINKCLAKDSGHRYQNTEELLNDLNVLRSEPVDRIHKSDRRKRRYVPRKIKWAIAGTIALLALLVFWRTFQSKFFSPEITVSASDKSIAVMYFENHTGNEDLDDMLVSMLTTNLSRYAELEVVSSQRLFDILKSMHRQDARSIDRSVATEIANRARVKTMLLGSIYRLGNKIRISTQLCDVATGNIVGSDNVDGNRVEEIFDMVDRLTQKVGRTLELIPPDLERQPFRISEVTTSSYQAYSFYQKGLRSFWDFQYTEAVDYFRRALEVDSTFAMASVQLALYKARYSFWDFDPYWDLSSTREALNQAKKFYHRLTEKEQTVIDIHDLVLNRAFEKADSLATFFADRFSSDKYALELKARTSSLLGKYAESILACEKALELDPTFEIAYSLLASNYSHNDEHAKAISAVKKYHALQPELSRALSFAWDIYMNAGQTGEALGICEQGIAKYPSEIRFQTLQGYTYLLAGKAEEARSKFQAHLTPSQLPIEHYGGAEDWQCPTAMRVSFSYLFEGNYKAAQPKFEKTVEIAKRINCSWPEAEREIPLSVFYEHDLGKYLISKREFEAARKAIAAAEEISWQCYDQTFNPVLILSDYLRGISFIKEGNFKLGQAAAEKIKSFLEQNNYDPLFLKYYYGLLAELYVEQGDGQAALDALAQIPHFIRRHSPRLWILHASALESQDKFEYALQVYNQFSHRIHCWSHQHAGDTYFFLEGRSKLDYRMARAFEQLGKKPQAIKYYQAALQTWKNADEDLPELSDTKARLAALFENK